MVSKKRSYLLLCRNILRWRSRKKELEMVADRFEMFASRLGSQAKKGRKTKLLHMISEILLTNDKTVKTEVDEVLPEVMEFKENKTT